MIPRLPINSGFQTYNVSFIIVVPNNAKDFIYSFIYLFILFLSVYRLFSFNAGPIAMPTSIFFLLFPLS